MHILGHDVHPCEKVVEYFFPESNLIKIIRLCLICIKRSFEEVKRGQISKRGYQQGPSDETMTKARYQFCDVKFGHRINVAAGLFYYKRNVQFTLIPLNFRNRWSKGVVSWSSDVILHISYFRELFTIKISENDRQKLGLLVTNIMIWPNRSINIRIYSGTVDKWFSMGVLSLVWHMTSFGLYYRPDCTMCVLSKSLQTRALPTNIQPDPYKRLSPQGGGWWSSLPASGLG